jgi:hypothetical protein
MNELFIKFAPYVGKLILTPANNKMYLWSFNYSGLCQCVADVNNPTPVWTFFLSDIRIIE